MPVAIVIVGEVGIGRTGLASLLRSEADFTVLGEANTTDDVHRFCEARRPPDVLVLRAGTNGRQLSGLAEFQRKRPEVGVLVIAEGGRQQAIAVLKMGVRGFVTNDQDAASLFNAIRSVSRGEVALSQSTLAQVADFLTLPAGGTVNLMPLQTGRQSRMRLTSRETEVLALISKGHANRDIAKALVISEHTVRAHMRNILDKLGVKNRIQAATWAVKVELDEPADSIGNVRFKAG